MRLLRFVTLSFPILLLSLAACGTVDKRVDPSVDDGVGGGGIESGDVVVMADKFARDLMAWPAFAKGEHAFYCTELINESSTITNKTLVLEKLETAVLRNSGGRLQFIDRSKEGMDAVMKERKAKREGAVSSSGNQALAGSDYVLKGSIKSIDKRGADLKSAYYLITLEATDLESSRKLWKNEYEFKWVGEKASIYR